MSDKNKSGLFKHPQDFHCAFYNLVVLFCYGLAFWLYRNPEVSGVESGGERIAFFLTGGLLLGWISGVNVGVNFHNHTHIPIFHSDFLNRWFGRLWAFNGGWPAFYWWHAHCPVHHWSLLSKEDWTMPRRRADGSFESIYSYVLGHWPFRFIPHLWRDFTGGRGGDWVPMKALKEGLIFLALWSIPFWIDPVMALGLWVLPTFVANWVMGSGMYVQHACTTEKCAEFPYSHSNSFQSRFFNLTMFNIGYHIVHHDHDQVHWSALPRFHEKLKPRLIAGGAHVVPYGYYHAAHLCSLMFRNEWGNRKFITDQLPEYGERKDPAAVMKNAAGRASPEHPAEAESEERPDPQPLRDVVA